jgi:CRP-like cAMP-binding protein
VAVSREAFQELLEHVPGLSGTIEEIMAQRMERAVRPSSCPAGARASRRRFFR